MTLIAYMSDEARRYYEGGKRVVVGGVPCRVADHGRVAGKAMIAKLVTSGTAIEAGQIDGASRFTFVPNDVPAQSEGKPSARGNYSYRNRFAHKSTWWKPTGISAAPMYGMTYGSLTDSSAAEIEAKRAWANGDADPLRAYLAKTAKARAETWAEIDAARAVEALAKAFAFDIVERFTERLEHHREVAKAKRAGKPVKTPVVLLEPVAPMPVPLPVAEPLEAPSAVDWAAMILASCQRVDTGPLLPKCNKMSPVTMTAAEFREIRERLGWTQARIAQWGGVVRQTIIRFEDGSQPVPVLWARTMHLLDQTFEDVKDGDGSSKVGAAVRVFAQ